MKISEALGKSNNKLREPKKDLVKDLTTGRGSLQVNEMVFSGQYK